MACRSRLGSGLLLLALGAGACTDSGHRLGRTLDGATMEIGASGGNGTGGAPGSGGNAPGTGGSSGGGGGAGGSGGAPIGSGGASGRTGGAGASGSGGNGGPAGSGGGGSGSGTGGRAGNGGVSGGGGASIPDGGAGDAGVAGQACSGKVVMECAEGLVCDLDVPGRCLASSAGGHCAIVPASCDGSGASVCGCDGRTYSTDCDRRRSRVQLDHTGACAVPDGGAQPVVCGAVTCAQAELCVHLCTCAVPGCQNPPLTCAATAPPSCVSPMITNGHAYCQCPP